MLGYVGFRRFQKIEAEAKGSVEVVTKLAEDAKRHVEEIESNRDRSAEVLRDMNAQIAADDPEEARQAAANVRENPTASPLDKAIARAVSLQQQGRRDEAGETWRAVAHVAEESDNDLAARAWFSVGYLVQNENPEDCIFANGQAIRLKPAFAEAYTNRGNAKRALGRHHDAIADHDEAIRLKPDLVKVYNNRGNAKRELGRHVDAIADHDEAIRLKPDYAVAYNNRGAAKHALERYDEALADYDKAIRLKPDLADAYNNRGNAKHALGQHEAAIADCDEAIRLKPDYAQAYGNRGNAKAALGLKDEARKDFERALALAGEAGDEELAAKAKRLLGNLDKGEGS